MKIIMVIVSVWLQTSVVTAAELTPREWVGFLHQISKRGKVQLDGANVAFTLERQQNGRGEQLNLVGIRDGEGGFTPVALLQVRQERLDGAVVLTATQVDLGGVIRQIMSRTLTTQSSGKPGESSSDVPTDAQKADWNESLEAWRIQVEQMPDRVGRFDAKEIAI